MSDKDHYQQIKYFSNTCDSFYAFKYLTIDYFYTHFNTAENKTPKLNNAALSFLNVLWQHSSSGMHDFFYSLCFSNSSEISSASRNFLIKRNYAITNLFHSQSQFVSNSSFLESCHPAHTGKSVLFLCNKFGTVSSGEFFSQLIYELTNYTNLSIAFTKLYSDNTAFTDAVNRLPASVKKIVIRDNSARSYRKLLSIVKPDIIFDLIRLKSFYEHVKSTSDIPFVDLHCDLHYVGASDYHLSCEHFAHPSYFPHFFPRVLLPLTPQAYYPLTSRLPAIPDIQPDTSSNINIGCFYRLMKVDEDHLSALAYLLLNLNNATLHIACLQSNHLLKTTIELYFESVYGIPRHRIIVHPVMQLRGLLSLINHMTCMIAPSPESSNISSFDCIVMGLPQIIIGTRHCSPLQQSVYSQLSLGEYLSPTPQHAYALILSLSRLSSPAVLSKRLQIRNAFFASDIIDTSPMVSTIISSIQHLTQ